MKKANVTCPDCKTLHDVELSPGAWQAIDEDPTRRGWALCNACLTRLHGLMPSQRSGLRKSDMNFLGYETEWVEGPPRTGLLIKALCGCHQHQGQEGDSTDGHPFCDIPPGEILLAEKRRLVERSYDGDQGWQWFATASSLQLAQFEQEREAVALDPGKQERDPRWRVWPAAI